MFNVTLIQFFDEVELAIAEMASTSRNVRRTFLVPSLLFQILRTVKDFPVVDAVNFNRSKARSSRFSLKKLKKIRRTIVFEK